MHSRRHLGQWIEQLGKVAPRVLGKIAGIGAAFAVAERLWVFAGQLHGVAMLTAHGVAQQFPALTPGF
ncbi:MULTISPECIES: hypothetical protein [Pseudomonas]|uniref:hypothetical protein n=1 Tax=Pseudomonas TaxID=286 RepID=UPI001C0A9101|nr:MULTISPECIES: hypothetical protein [Pseudomonas]MCK3838609.1 hypothetical protein [Pseudomonas sp. NCIMB 10586]MCK3844448.1 hypothetical protein [Pseudomonas sp. W15Feb34]MCK3864233.1 hypothetical protein [Pseudomonas sp. B329]